jgi:hypothetical protein
MFSCICNPKKDAAKITFFEFRTTSEVQIKLIGGLGRRKFEEFRI